MNTFEFSPDLDTGFLLSIYENDMLYAEEIFANFLISLPEALKEMEDAIEKSNTELFKSVVHRIKPSFSYVGLSEITLEMDNLQKECLHTSDMNQLTGRYKPLLERIRNKIILIQQELKRIQEFNNR